MDNLVVTMALFIIGTIVFLLVEAYHTKVFKRIRIVEMMHQDGSIDYSLERNGFLLMPFLYSTMTLQRGNHIFETNGLSLEEAKAYKKQLERKYFHNKVISKSLYNE